MPFVRRHVVVLARNGNSSTIALPRKLMREMKISLGDHFAIQRVGSSILLVPVEEQIRAQMTVDQAAAVVAEQEILR